MTRGGSASRTPAARSAAAAKGWEARKRRAHAQAMAALAMTPQELAALRGTQSDRVLSDIKGTIANAIAALREGDA